MKTIGTGAFRLAALLIVPALAACASGAPMGDAMDAEPMGEAGEAGAHAAVETITAQDVAREIGILADDSMAGRDTPSPELTAAADYLAGRFQAMGLEPAGENGGYLDPWDYQVTSLSPEETSITVGDGGSASLVWGADFFLVPGMQPTTAEAVYAGVAGQDQPTAADRGKILFIDHPVPELNQEWQQTLMMALQPAMMTGAAGIVVVMDPEFPTGLIGQLAPSTAGQQAPFPVVGMTSDAAARLLQDAGLDLAEVRAAGASTALGDAPIQISWARADETHRPVNVAAMLRGSDPELRDTYVVLTAHFDHVGVGSPNADGDSIYNGADDNASGTAGVLEVAEAFASLDTAPARSIIFVAVSGEEKGLLGSMAYASDPPLIDIGSVVANVNMDMIGRNAPDTVIGIGQEYSTLEGVLDEIQDHHPELGLNVILDPVPEENYFFRSDQLAFIQQGIPAVFFTTSDHEDYHQPSDEADKIDNDKVARVARMAFLVAYHVAQDPTAPEWTAEGRARIEGMLQQSPF